MSNRGSASEEDEEDEVDEDDEEDEEEELEEQEHTKKDFNGIQANNKLSAHSG